MLTPEKLKAGLQIRNRLVGERFALSLAKLPEGDIRKTFTDLVDEFCFASVWTRETIAVKERSMLTLAVLATLGRKEEFQLHTRGALNNGCTPAEVYEVVLHIAVYAGLPAGSAALRWAHEILDKQDEPKEGR